MSGSFDSSWESFWLELEEEEKTIVSTPRIICSKINPNAKISVALETWHSDNSSGDDSILQLLLEVYSTWSLPSFNILEC